MSLRTLAARLFRFSTPEPRPPAHPLQVVYQDAHTLLTAIYGGYPWSRRAWERRMGQMRWQRATFLLRAAGILDRRGRYVFDYERDWATACDDLLQAANAEATRRTHPTYVPARR